MESQFAYYMTLGKLHNLPLLQFPLLQPRIKRIRPAYLNKKECMVFILESGAWGGASFVSASQILVWKKSILEGEGIPAFSFYPLYTKQSRNNID